MFQRIYLIVEAMGPVAEDLRMSIEEVDDSAASLVARTPDAALALVGDNRISVAFVHADPARFAATALEPVLAAQGTRIIFMGNAAEESRAPGRLIMQRPFSSETVAEIVRPLLQSRVA
ncbi:hypothetical protein RNZ50_12070 [Paracoccaceae bacterium Fryx2]|nr:hypothetical protein [Paracoccaceae bacterium Fryx2]